MMTQNPPSNITNKASLRRLLRLQRSALSAEYRQQASFSIFQQLEKILKGKQRVASYCTINEELDTSLINKQLVQEQRLILPRLNGEKLQLFHVTDFSQLTKGPHGISEPNPDLCVEISPQEIDAILVPGIAFDRAGHRLGYGKGYYDRLLEEKGEECLVIGIAYKEQIVNFLLPFEEHDQPMAKVITD